VNSTPSDQPADQGFTLVELVVAISILFIALIAATQIIVSMVSATVINRHTDLAVSVASLTMETAVAFDCGGQLVDPGWVYGVAENPATTPTTNFYGRLQDRCKVDTNRVANTAADAAACPAAGAAPDVAFNNGFLPTIDLAQADLGSRRFIVNKIAASSSSAASAAPLAVCTTVRMSWKHVKSAGSGSVADNGTNDSLRLQRQVHVQWKELRQTAFRSRDLLQISSLPPDSKVALSTGRISMVEGVGKAATLILPETGQRLTLVADDNSGVVNFPFLPDGEYDIIRSSGVTSHIVVSAISGRSVCQLPGAVPAEAFNPIRCRI
jgi:prepilin-type N-terminal cleavage/methylation domain-containing protein